MNRDDEKTLVRSMELMEALHTRQISNTAELAINLEKLRKKIRALEAHLDMHLQNHR